jgi:hypothetical protein
MGSMGEDEADRREGRNAGEDGEWGKNGPTVTDEGR